MTEQELINWHHEHYWPMYRRMLQTPWSSLEREHGPGGKGESLKKMLQLKPSEALRDRITNYLREAIDTRSKCPRTWFSDRTKIREHTVLQNRMSKTWLHNRGWEDELPSLLDEPDIRDEPRDRIYCSEEDCGNNAVVTADGWQLCAKHWTLKNNPKLRQQWGEALAKNGLTKREDESREEWLQRCKEFALGGMRRLEASR